MNPIFRLMLVLVPVFVAVSFEAVMAQDSDLKVVELPGRPPSQANAETASEQFAWYRAYVQVPAAWQGSRLLLIAGEIDGVDEAFFNGRKVGANGAMPPLYNAPASSVRRPFVIEPDWIQFGEENLIAWRVFNKRGTPGIVKGPLHLTRKDDAIDISGNWQFRVGDSMSWGEWVDDVSKVRGAAKSFRDTGGANFAGSKGVVAADKKYREDMIAAVYKKFEGNPNPYARNDDKGAPLDPDASRETFVIEDGLAVDTVLAEPLVRQPLYVEFDERGRLWVVQYIQYPNPAGLEVLTWDNHLRKVFDQVPPPPPFDSPEKAHFAGHDRITIHEDSDGDGIYDTHKVFLDGLSLATSIARGSGGVWVMQPPYLLFYADANNDDIPDADPVVHLSGFGLEDTHSIANSLKWGPDGWLYGGVGSTVTARVLVHLSGSDYRHSFFGQNIWRYHPETHVFELFAEGGWNTFGVDFDDKGRVYSGTNGNMQAVHFVQGGYYQKSFGKHGPHTNSNTFGHFHGIPIKGEPIRMVHQWIYYNSGAIPALDGLLVGGNALGSKIHALRMDPMGSTFETVEQENPLRTDHKWFRPVHATVGPDGAIYLSDFYDARITHVDPRDNWDRDRGRIYRLRAASATPAAAPDLSKLTSAELVAALESRNQWMRRTAQRLLADRNDDSVLSLLVEKMTTKTGTTALEMLWAVNGIGALTDEILVNAMRHEDAHVRSWAVRFAGDPKATLLPEVFNQITALAADDESAEVVSQLASTAARLPSPQALPVIQMLSARDTFADDPFIPQQIWWALEAQITRDPLRCLAMFEESGFWESQIVKRTLAERIGRRFMADRTPGNLDVCAQLLRECGDVELGDALVRGMELALEGTSLAEVPEELDSAVAQIWSRYPDSKAMIGFALRLRSSKALEVARNIVADSSAESELRMQFIATLTEMGDEPMVPVLLKIVGSSDSEASLRMAALNGLRRYANEDIPVFLLAEYLKMSIEMRKTVQAILAAREDWSLLLLAAVDAGKLPRESVTFDTLLSIQSRNRERANAIITKHWGSLRQPAEEKARQMQKIRNVLAKGGGAGDVVQGEALFAVSCGACHRLGEVGKNIAPDLTGYERGNLDFLLPAIVDPNMGVREEFELVTLTLRSEEGQVATVLSGFVSDSNEQAITLKDLVGNSTVIARRDIAQQTRLPVSVMPEGLLDDLSDQQLLDLFAFLQKKL